MRKRIEKVLKNIGEYNVDIIIITNVVNIKYLLGFSCTYGILILGKGRKGLFFTDGRYYHRAKSEVEGVSVRLIANDWLTDVGEWINRLKIKRAGFEANHLSFSLYSRLKKKLRRGLKLVPLENVVEEVRQIKELTERKKIKKAVEITEGILWKIKGYVSPGESEWQVKNFIEHLFTEFGVEPSFPPIVAVGRNSANPHPVVSKKRIIKKETQILVDLGIKFDGYSSDLTRTFWIGRITRTFRQVYQAVLKAQREGLQKLAPGVVASEVDEWVRRYLRKAGLVKYFTHGLGHGVGIEVHEIPRLSKRSRSQLQPGTVITVEPGVYLPGWGGVRIEDMVFIKGNGIEVLSRFPKELEEIAL